jgi:hypothetical protein
MTQLPTTSLHHPAESELFDETLSCELALPAEFQAAARPAVPAAPKACCAAWRWSKTAALTSTTTATKPACSCSGWKAKLDLAMVLLGRLVRQQGQELTLRPVRWSRRGIRLQLGPRSGASPGQAGLVRLQPSDWLPDHIDLPVEVLPKPPTAAAATSCGCASSAWAMAWKWPWSATCSACTAARWPRHAGRAETRHHGAGGRALARPFS